ncbi:MAG: GspE/PulE family protein [Candidatus Liptonbacteria bacterium]
MANISEGVSSKLIELIKRPKDQISVVELVDLMVQHAFLMDASDIHLEPAEQEVRLRLRIDGMLVDVLRPAQIIKELHPEIISRIKVLSGMRTDEHLVPQDGRFKVKINMGEVDVRVSIMPTYHGENAIMRILAESHSFKLEELGFSPQDLARVEKTLEKPYGMILANGPTGSGKTTTLYTILKRLNQPESSVITIEDPIEYYLEGTTQIQTNTQVGLTFANGLRSILRQDPNTVMVGEIRDEETASIAVNAALTGHLVLSTLHTSDAATTFPRLMDMKVPPFLVASTVNVAMGQRLIRTICTKCRLEIKLTEAEAKSVDEILPGLATSKSVFYRGQGCDNCKKTGYQGRIGIREVLMVSDNIRQMIMDHANATQVKDAAVKEGMTTMVQDGIRKAQEGVTTIEEVLRIIHE